MKKALAVLATGLLALALPSRADVLIYKQKLSQTSTGGGSVQKASLTGWLIVDPNSSRISVVTVNNSTKHFSAQDALKSFTDFVTGKNGVTNTVYVYSGTDSGAIVARGTNAKTVPPQGLSVPWKTPLAMTIVGTILDSGNPDSFLSDYKGTLLYDQANTVFANQNSFTIDDAVNAFRQALLNQGLTEQ